MKVIAERIVTGTLLLCAIAVTGLLLRRELSPQTAAAAAADTPVKVEKWADVLGSGVHFGAPQGRISIAVLSDFQCPFCRQFHQTLRQVREEFGDEISVVYIHYPLSYHPQAVPAALASECAASQGRFDQFADAVFDSQDSLGILPWTVIASTAGVPDISKFDECVRGVTTHPRIEIGRSLAKDLGAGGTPTVMINGWRLSGVPTADALRAIVADILAGRSFPSRSVN